MHSRPYALLVGVAVVTGLVAILASAVLGLPLRDPDGFLGPSWVRLPALGVGAFLADVVPRAAWRARGERHRLLPEARRIVGEHWTPDRVRLVGIGLAAFYVTYVGYRNLKNFLPFVRTDEQDRLLKRLDEALMLGGDPALLLHRVLGQEVSAQILSVVYLLFLPFVPISLVAWLVWSRRTSHGYWYATAQCLSWALGAASYYAVPSLGPVFRYPRLYSDLPSTGVSRLKDSLDAGRKDVIYNPFTADAVQSVAGFASLHVAVVLCAAMVASHTVRQAWVRRSLWVFFALTVIATIYFGWHYLADDLAGALIGVVSVYIAGVATGHRFRRPTVSRSRKLHDAAQPEDEALTR